MRKIFFITIFGMALLGVLVIPWKAAHGAPNISSDPFDHWSWNDVVGWFDWNKDGLGDVEVDSQQLKGRVNSSIGEISLNCATPIGGGASICSDTIKYEVLNDGSGGLSGWAWNDAFGWFSFCGAPILGRSDCPYTDYYYQVRIDSGGDFRGYAWNDILGWVSFNCLDLYRSSHCPNAYKVKTSWVPTVKSGYLESATIDTGDVAGAQFNSIVWRGSQPAGTMVKFKFAASNNSDGPWGESDFRGNDCSNASYYYSIGPDKSVSLNFECGHNNKQYFRYRVYLDSDITQMISPRVDEVIVNWSP